MGHKRPPTSLHEDAGLQPERTTLAWGRTMMALVTVSAISFDGSPTTAFRFWRCSPSRSQPAATIYFTQRRRYSASSHGITRERVNAEIGAVLWTASTGIALGALGIAVVLAS